MSRKLTPAEYAVVKGADLYGWQIDALESFGQGWPTSLLTCNGAGKTSVVASWAVAWLFYRFPKAQLVATSGSWTQLSQQLWPNLSQHLPDGTRFAMGNSPCTINTPDGGKGVGFSTNDPGKAEGWHPKIAEDVDPVCILVDESKTVPEGIFEAFDRCTVAFQLYISSAGAPRGRFYNTHHKLSGEYWTKRVPYSLCPHIKPEKIEKARRTYGESHPLFRSMMLAEFTADEDRLILTPTQLQSAIDGQPELDTEGEVVAFCDFAAGRDENVLAVRRGNSVKIVKAWRESDTIQAGREFIRLFKREGLRASQIWGDADGLGVGFCCWFDEEGWRINRFHGGQAATNKTEYANLIGQVWHVATREIDKGAIHLGQLDPQLFEQMTTRKSEWSDNGKLRCESKEKMAKAGLKSPDRADALLGAIFCGSRMSGRFTAADSIRTTASPFAAPRFSRF